MNEIYNYKYLFFKELYDSLNLNIIEQKLVNEKVKSLNVVPNEKYSTISNYFFLLNDLNTEPLTKEQLQFFHLYFSKDISLLTEQEIKEAKGFINKTYSLLLFPKCDSKYKYYGSINDNYIAPTDAIVIGLYYDAFGNYDDFEIKNKLATIINYIQFNLAKKINIKISVIPFNQITLQEKNSSLSK